MKGGDWTTVMLIYASKKDGAIGRRWKGGLDCISSFESSLWGRRHFGWD